MYYKNPFKTPYELLRLKCYPTLAGIPKTNQISKFANRRKVVRGPKKLYDTSSVFTRQQQQPNTARDIRSIKVNNELYVINEG